MSTRPLAGRVAVVTGVSRRAGIGAAIARRLAADGADLLLHGWSPHDAEYLGWEDVGGAQALQTELTAAGARVELLAADLADPQAPAAVIAAALAAYGRVDVLVANHARSAEQGLEDLTAAEVDLCFAVNARATLLLVQAFAAACPGAGRVVLFTSGQYNGAMADELPYIASKGALHQLTPSLAVHLAPRGITVNCLDPGPNDTGYASPADHAAVAARHPSGRWGRPEDAARLVAWLVSDEADWVTGQVVASDGGWSVRPR